MKPYDFAEPFLRTSLGFIGLIDITTYSVLKVFPFRNSAISALPKAVGEVNEFTF